MKNRNILKIDLDLEFYEESKELIRTRLTYLNSLNILSITNIKKIELIKKNKYSCKITLVKDLLNPYYIIIFQAILGDDWRRIAITFRDLKLGMSNYNRLFNIKTYSNGEVIEGDVIDITKDILEAF